MFTSVHASIRRSLLLISVHSEDSSLAPRHFFFVERGRGEAGGPKGFCAVVLCVILFCDELFCNIFLLCVSVRGFLFFILLEAVRNCLRFAL